jgi:hypothetical protein
MKRRYKLHSELEDAIKCCSDPNSLSIETLYASTIRACQILKEVYYDPGVYVNNPEAKVQLYMKLVHAVEYLNALEYLLRGMSLKDSIGMALRWRWDRRCIPPEEEVFVVEEIWR